MPDQSEGEAATEQQTPEYVTADDVARVVNSAVTSQLKRALPNTVKAALGELNLDEKIAEVVKTALPQPQEQSETQTDSAKDEATRKMEAAIEKLSKELEAEQAKREAAERASADEAQKRLHTNALVELRSGLEKHVRPEMLDVVVRDLDKGQSRLVVDEAGKASLRVQKPPYKGAPPEDVELPIAEAVGVYTKSDEAKPFLPAPGGQGGERRNATRPTVKHAPPDGGVLTADQKAENALLAMEEMGESLPGM